MPGPEKPERVTGRKLERLRFIRRPERLERFNGVLISVKRQCGTVPAESFLVRVFRVLFLEVAGVRKNEARQVHGRGRGKDASAKPVLDQAGDVTDVVKVRVRQDEPLNAGRWDGKRFPVALAQLLFPLEKAAVNHQALACGFEEVLGAGYCSRSAEKSQSCHIAKDGDKRLEAERPASSSLVTVAFKSRQTPEIRRRPCASRLKFLPRLRTSSRLPGWRASSCSPNALSAPLPRAPRPPAARRALPGASAGARPVPARFQGQCGESAGAGGLLPCTRFIPPPPVCRTRPPAGTRRRPAGFRVARSRSRRP